MEATGIPERFRHWDERHDLRVVGHLTMRDAGLAVRRSLPTMDHAVRLVEEVLSQLGPRGFLDPEGGEHRRRVLLRDAEHAEWLVPHALVEQSFGPSASVDTGILLKNSDPVLPLPPADGAARGDRRPEILPHGPTMRGGEVTLCDGPAYYTLRYDDRGWRRESSESVVDQFSYARYANVKPYVLDPTARPPTPMPLALLCRDDLDASGQPLPDFARMVRDLKLAERVAARVCMPQPLPFGALGCWLRAIGSIRESLWRGAVEPGARWLVVDGYEGIARASGKTLEEACARWADEVRRVEPLPPDQNRITQLPSKAPPPEPCEPSVREDKEKGVAVFSTGTMTLTFQAPPSALEWPAPGLDATPAVAIPIPPPPADVPPLFREYGFRRWIPLVGGFGHVYYAPYRDEEPGFTLVGDGILDIVDPSTITAEMDASDAEQRAWMDDAPDAPNIWTDPISVYRLVQYTCWDHGHQKRIPLQHAGGQFGGGWSPQSLDGDAIRWQVVRLSRR